MMFHHKFKSLFLRSNPQPLHLHKRVGLDLDGTIINGANEDFIKQWLSFTRSEVHIITFRHSISQELVDHLKNYTAIVCIHFLPRNIREFSNEYLLWKGKTCYENNLTALIDDDEVGVINGCKKYGIKFVNALDWKIG